MKAFGWVDFFFSFPLHFSSSQSGLYTRQLPYFVTSVASNSIYRWENKIWGFQITLDHITNNCHNRNSEEQILILFQIKAVWCFLNTQCLKISRFFFFEHQVKLLKTTLNFAFFREFPRSAWANFFCERMDSYCILIWLMILVWLLIEPPPLFFLGIRTAIWMLFLLFS